jgi:hypothetical protein
LCDWSLRFGSWLLNSTICLWTYCYYFVQASSLPAVAP